MSVATICCKFINSGAYFAFFATLLVGVKQMTALELQTTKGFSDSIEIRSMYKVC